MSKEDRKVADAFASIAAGDPEALRSAVTIGSRASALDPKCGALVRLATSVALDAPPATYAWQVDEALSAGAGPAELLALLQTVSPQVGAARAVAAAPEIMLALGLRLPGPDVDADDEAS